MALLWVSASWHGYSSRILDHFVTGGVDLFFLLSFGALAAVLGRPLVGTRCSAATTTTTTTTFRLQVPNGSIVFPYDDGRAACSKMLAVLALAILVPVFFLLSLASLVALARGERRTRRAVYGVAAGVDRSVGVGFAPGVAGGYYPVSIAGNLSKTPGVVDELPRSPATPPYRGFGISDDSLPLNSPVTIGCMSAENQESHLRAHTGLRYGKSMASRTRPAAVGDLCTSNWHLPPPPPLLAGKLARRSVANGRLSSFLSQG